jgi:hypothetical protein
MGEGALAAAQRAALRKRPKAKAVKKIAKGSIAKKKNTSKRAKSSS